MAIKYFIIILAMLLAGCSTININTAYNAAANLNLDQQHKALPVQVKVYQLRDKDAFMQATFRDLWQQDSSVLGDSLLAKQILTINPGSKVNTAVSCSKKCRYLGVVALFRKPASDNWRVLYKIPHGVSVLSPTMRVNLNNNKITLR